MPYLLPLPSLDAFWHDSLYWLRTASDAGKGASDTEMAQWEADTGFTLPESLRALYSQRNGGVSDWLNAVVGVEGPISLHPNFGNYWSRLGEEGPLRGVTLGEASDGIDFGDEDEDDEERKASYRHAFGDDVDKLWVIANHGSSNYLLLDYRTDAQQPAVTLFDDESRFRGDATVIKGAGLYVLARTIDEFLRNCRREIPHPLRVWSVEGLDASALGQRLVERLQASVQPVATLQVDGNWGLSRPYGERDLRLTNPYLAEELQPDFGPVQQYSGGLLGNAVLRAYRNRSDQGTRAERFAGDDAVLVSLLLPSSIPVAIPHEASDAIEAAFDSAGLNWTRQLDTDAAEFVAEDELLSPAINHPHPDVKSLHSEQSGA